MGLPGNVARVPLLFGATPPVQLAGVNQSCPCSMVLAVVVLMALSGVPPGVADTRSVATDTETT